MFDSLRIERKNGRLARVVAVSDDHEVELPVLSFKWRATGEEPFGYAKLELHGIRVKFVDTEDADE